VERRLVPHVGLVERFKKINIEVELGFTAEEGSRGSALLELRRPDGIAAKLCIECDAASTFCPGRLPHHHADGTESELRARLTAPATNHSQACSLGALPQTGGS